jgi:hypothetical protein
MLSSARPDIGSRGEVQLNFYHFLRLAFAPSESPGDTPHILQETPHVPAGYTPRAAGGESRPAGLKSFLVFFIKCYPVPVPTLAPEEKYNSIANTSGILLLSIKCYPVPVLTLAPEVKYNSIAIIFWRLQMLSSARPDIGSRGEVQLNCYHFWCLAPSESPGDTSHVPQETPHVPAGYTPRAAGGGSRRP